MGTPATAVWPSPETISTVPAIEPEKLGISGETENAELPPTPMLISISGPTATPVPSWKRAVTGWIRFSPATMNGVFAFASKLSGVQLVRTGCALTTRPSASVGVKLRGV